MTKHRLLFLSLVLVLLIPGFVLALSTFLNSAPIIPIKTPLISLISSLPTKYSFLLGHKPINLAVTRSGPLQTDELTFLRDKILELENNQTANWGQFWHPFPYSEIDTRKIWLQQVALSFYVETNKIVPWSILGYSSSSLNLLLAYKGQNATAAGLDELFVLIFNHNPLIPYQYAGGVASAAGGNAHLTPKDFLAAVIMKMRADGWSHLLGNPPWPCSMSDHFMVFIDFACLGGVKQGSSSLTPLFIKTVLASYNLPSELIRPYFGHGGIFFPTLALAMDGDAIYSDFLAGIRIRPNKIPPQNSLLDLTLVKSWLALRQCAGARMPARADVLSYLGLYDRPEWNEDVIAAYLYNPNNNPNDPTGRYAPGEWLKGYAEFINLPFFCQTTDSTAANYWAPILSDEEWGNWFQQIDTLTSSIPSI